MVNREPEPASKDPAGRWMRVLSREEFARWMGAAMEASLIERGAVTPTRARLLASDALKRFAGLARLRTRRVRGVSREDVVRELEQAHAGLLRDRQRLKGEVSRLEQHVRADPAAGLLADAEAELDQALRADLEALPGSHLPREAIEAFLRRERARRERLLARAMAPERERIDTLERRLAKLQSALQEQERELVELARRAALDTGVPSIYREVQGLRDETGDRAAKAELLTKIFEQNLVLQGKA